MELLLIRHAQTTSNVDGALDTAHPGADLTALGDEQTAELAALLADERLEAVWCSPRLRTRRTAAAVADPRGLEPVIRDGLVEIDAGDWEMSTVHEHAVGYNATVTAWLSGDPDAVMPGGAETGAEALARFDAVIEEVAASGCERVAVVAHGAVIRMWCGARIPDLPRGLAAERPLRNTGLVRLVGTPGAWRCVEWDQQVVAHGGEAGPTAEPSEPDVE